LGRFLGENDDRGKEQETTKTSIWFQEEAVSTRLKLLTNAQELELLLHIDQLTLQDTSDASCFEILSQRSPSSLSERRGFGDFVYL
jgi:hypothetical protein